jgi:hypothetical protein
MIESPTVLLPVKTMTVGKALETLFGWPLTLIAILVMSVGDVDVTTVSETNVCPMLSLPYVSV